VHDWLLKDNLLSDPLPPYFGQVSTKRGDRWPPPTSGVKEKMIMFPKEQVELKFVATSSKPIYPNARRPTIECHWWWCILSVWFGKGEVLQTHNGFGESIHEYNTKLNRSRAKFLEVTNANNPFR
jgi:hypothetical protein